MSTSLNAVCLFCGSNPGRDPEYRRTAEQLGRILAKRRITMVYGGGNVGLMGIAANACLDAEGQVIGVIPRSLRNRELAHEGITRLHVVNTMHERKALMAELSDGFICLPGGYGTFEEFCEVITWSQLGIHAKPCGVLNVLGYYDLLLAQFDRGVTDGFIRPAHREMVFTAADSEQLLDAMSSFQFSSVPKWLSERDA